ncbi:hypothetical protein N9M01_12000 [Luminiphilus sp.]|nr:hypothetical protein [Luminiphilus sp.]
MLSIFMILAGCSTSEGLSESKESHLIQRVTARWQCLERNDYACAYKFLSPAYRRVFTPEMYRNRYFSELERVLTGVKVVAYDRKAAVASVMVGVMSSSSTDASSASRASSIVPSTLAESWIQYKGEWWYHDRS